MNQALERYLNVEGNHLLNQHVARLFGEAQFQTNIKDHIDQSLMGNIVNSICFLKDHSGIKKNINLEYIPFSKESNIQGLIILFRTDGRAKNKTFSNGWGKYNKKKKHIDHQLQTNYEGFKRRLKIQYPHLTHKDLIHCSLIRMNLSTEETARYFNVNPTSVQKMRVRLKKKLSLSKEDDLIKFLFVF
jgi:DNA-binding CsgD family transcriptional regulator